MDRRSLHRGSGDRWRRGPLRTAISFHCLQVPTGAGEHESYKRAARALYVVCYMQSKLGYFVNLKKSQLRPVSRMVHLGLGICSTSMSFWIPDKKKEAFARVREDILAAGRVRLKDMQRFVGKCQSFVLVRLFVQECAAFTPKLDDITASPLTRQVREEVLFWRFIDSVSHPIPWRQERHLSLRLCSDASGYRWGGVRSGGGEDITFGDYWPPEVQRSSDICYKEALALYFVLVSNTDHIWDRRVDVQVDYESLCQAWSSLKARSAALAGVLKLVFAFTLEANFDLRLQWIPSSSNRADIPSRALSRADSRLSPSVWRFLQEEFGGSTGFKWDLMALPSNVPKGKNGFPVKFFSRDPVPGTSGVNVFAQPCPRGEVLYVFPLLSSSLIRLLQEWGDVVVTLVVPKHPHPKPWWTHLCSLARKSMRLSEIGQAGVIHLLFSPAARYLKRARLHCRA